MYFYKIKMKGTCDIRNTNVHPLETQKQKASQYR